MTRKELKELRPDIYILWMEEFMLQLGEDFTIADFFSFNNTRQGREAWTELHKNRDFGLIDQWLDKNKKPVMTRENFMEFFRNDDCLNTLSPDDRNEIFCTIQLGSCDFTVELLDGILRDYGVENISVVEGEAYSKADILGFVEWIHDKKHGPVKPMHEAMIIYKVKTIEELFYYYLNNVKKMEITRDTMRADGMSVGEARDEDAAFLRSKGVDARDGELTPDEKKEQFRDKIRNAVLDALDETSPTHKGWKDEDLPQLFKAIDQHSDKLFDRLWNDGQRDF